MDLSQRNKENFNEIFNLFLQRPFYWSWGGASISNATNKWPSKEDKLKKHRHSHKSTKFLHTTERSKYSNENQLESEQKSQTNSFYIDKTNLQGRTSSDGYVTYSDRVTSDGYVTARVTNNDVTEYRVTSAGRYVTDRVSSNDLVERVTKKYESVNSTVDDYFSYKAYGKNGSFSITTLHTSFSNMTNNSSRTKLDLLNNRNTTEYLITQLNEELFTKRFPLTPFSNQPNGFNNVTNLTYIDDISANGTLYAEDAVELAAMILTGLILGLVILATVIGNVFVIAAILLERNLQNVANYLILSLAVADLLVACLVMPLGAVYEVSKQWTLGPELCDMWTSSDVLCCTASILHLVAIALDRYWAVTNIDYIHQRTSKRIGLMIFIIWGVAFLVCIAPMLGWKDPEWELRILKNQTCLISQDIGYQIFATASSFYVPLFVILVLYWRIFQTARKRIRRRGNPGANQPRNPAAGGVIAGAAGGSGNIAAAVVAVIGRPLPTISETTTAFTTVSSTNTSPEKQSMANGIEPDLPTADCLSSYQQQVPVAPPKRKNKEAADSKRERKAAKTLAIITGAFVICWLPFFILAILLPTCKTCYFNEYMISFFLWLGYFNSTLNPIIYTIFSPEFRHAFKRILCGRKGSIRRRNVRHYGQRHFQ